MMNHESTRKIPQAHLQAPWRIQVQRVAFIMLGLIVVMLVAGLYLNISAQTAAIGVEIQNLEATREATIRANADLKGRLGSLTTIENMQKRAAELGFEPVDPNAATYMVIPEYSGRQVAVLAPSGRSESTLRRPVIKPSYTQSLWEWVVSEMGNLNQASGGAR